MSGLIHSRKRKEKRENREKEKRKSIVHTLMASPGVGSRDDTTGLGVDPTDKGYIYVYKCISISIIHFISFVRIALHIPHGVVGLLVVVGDETFGFAL